MNAIFAKILYELEKKHDMVLVTIISQEGSSPRGLGAQMLVKADGGIVGSVGGGAVEEICRECAAKCIQDKRSTIKEYSLRQNGENSIGMVCGGDVTAFLQFVDSEKTEWAELSQKMLSVFSEHKSGWLVLHLDGSIPSLVDVDGVLLFGDKKDAEQVPENARFLKTRTDFYMQLPICDRAILFGGGHCAQALVPFLAKVGFRVTVMDNRPEYATTELFPEAETVICGDYCKIADYLTLIPSDYVVIMSNGHEHDLDVQKQVLRHPPYYVGVIGSKSKKAFVNANLREAGITDEVINSIHTPVGTAIKAVTPEEIAISIAGEMIYERALLRESCGIKTHGCPMH